MDNHTAWLLEEKAVFTQRKRRFFMNIITKHWTLQEASSTKIYEFCLTIIVPLVMTLTSLQFPQQRISTSPA
jgi:hypothetical protein